MNTRIISLLGVLIAFAFGELLAGQKPNVILMMADDLGYKDLSCYGSEIQKTPVLDKLAKEGIRLTSFYAGATVCTPSRMALLTGAYPPRVGWRGGVVGYGIKTLNGLAPEALTMGEVFYPFSLSRLKICLQNKQHDRSLLNWTTHQCLSQPYCGSTLIKGTSLGSIRR